MNSLPSDPYDFALLVTAGLLVLVGVILLLRRPWRPQNPFPYRLQGFANELQCAWFPRLVSAVRDDYAVLPAVALVDLLVVEKTARGKLAQRAAQKLEGQMVDFLLLTPETLEPMAAVLLQSGEPLEAFRGAALLAAGLPVVSLPGAPLLSETELRDFLQGELSGVTPVEDGQADGWSLGTTTRVGVESQEWSLGDVKPATASGQRQSEEFSDNHTWGACPECGAPRSPRRVSRGRHAGKYFLVCSAYPGCQYLQLLNRRHH